MARTDVAGLGDVALAAVLAPAPASTLGSRLEPGTPLTFERIEVRRWLLSHLHSEKLLDLWYEEEKAKLKDLSDGKHSS